MGRLVAAVIALAIFLTGAMYWSQAHQDDEGTAPNGVYPCVKSTASPADQDAQQEAASKEKCPCCCGGK